jgi:hypothetical protein
MPSLDRHLITCTLVLLPILLGSPAATRPEKPLRIRMPSAGWRCRLHQPRRPMSDKFAILKKAKSSDIASILDGARCGSTAAIAGCFVEPPVCRQRGWSGSSSFSRLQERRDRSPDSIQLRARPVRRSDVVSRLTRQANWRNVRWESQLSYSAVRVPPRTWFGSRKLRSRPASRFGGRHSQNNMRLGGYGFCRKPERPALTLSDAIE